MSEKLFITRKRKKYKFAKFNKFDNCFQFDEWFRVVASLVKQSSDIILEIGAGTGLLSVELAKRYPEKFFIAVDIKSDRLYTGARYANEQKLNNIIFVRSDVIKFLHTLPQRNISEIWITFPDPHASEDQTRLTSTGDRKRLTAKKFLDYYEKILKNNGKINFKTDNEPLFGWSIEQIESCGWSIEKKSVDLHNSKLDDDKKIMTTYEERFIKEGLSIYYLSATIGR